MSKLWDKKMMAYIKKKVGVNVREESMPEIRMSMYHLGKAIFLYYSQKKSAGDV